MELNRFEAHDAAVQAAYARWLDLGAKAGFVLCLVALLAYLSGAAAPYVSLAQLATLWSLPVGPFLQATAGPTGWGWVGLLGYGDYLNMLGIALFASVTVACYLRAMAALWACGDRLYAAIAAAQIAVLIFAASGLLH